MKDDVAVDLYMTVRGRLLKRLKEEEVTIYTNTKVSKIEGTTVFAEKDGQELVLDGFDNIIFAVGSKSEEQFENVEDLANEVYVIGDAKKARTAVEAIYEGARVGMSI